MKGKVLITGAGGQLGQELQLSAAPGADCVAVTRAQLDIGDAAAVAAFIGEEKPHLVINAAAYTAVDKAESEPEVATRVNAVGPENLARACRDSGARLIHVSTDFVFDGRSSSPYGPGSPTSPLSEYGRGKLQGELAVQQLLPDALIIRTGWVYSRFGGNFVKTMLRLMAEREELSVVVDQVGTPTWANGLAKAIWAASDLRGLNGIYHWSDAGVCSWYDFAVAISEEASAMGLLARGAKVLPIPGSSYPTPATRPEFSVLDKASSWQDFQLEGVHWRTQLRLMLQDLKDHEYE
ncbi:MAG: dTDP-4-dehydrorhamnose reductase [Halioglobus sp.]